MPRISGTHLFNSSQRDIFDAVMDIEQYPRLFHFIRRVEILSRAGSETVVKLDVGFSALSFSYTCRVTTTGYERVDIVAIDGPFHYLKASIDIIKRGQKRAQADYTFDAKFKSRWMEILATQALPNVFRVYMRQVRDYLDKRDD